MEFSGYGAVFNNVDSYGDLIVPGAFTKFLADVKSGLQNWPAMLLGNSQKISSHFPGKVI